MVILTAILIIVAFVIGVLVGRILKMSFGCPDKDSSSNTALDTKSGSSSASSTSNESVSAASAGFVSTGNNKAADKDTQTKTPAAKKSTGTKAKSPATKSNAASKTSTGKSVAKSSKAAPAKATKAKKNAPATKAKRAATKTVAASNTADDLKLIKGVGKMNETRLNNEGITTFAQVGSWKKADIAEFDEKLNFKGRIEREEWVPQAKALAKAKAKTTSAKPVAAKKAPVKKAAPVKSASAAKTAAKKATPKASVKKAAVKSTAKKASTPDDLKLIKGVGKLIETKLAKEGITSYSQIAAWKKADVTEFDEKLSFKGRIERDDWIKQAKVLAKGGTTEFSKRAAKGDVPSSS